MSQIDRPRAVIRGRKRLAWAGGAAGDAVGTPHPRAASGLAWIGGEDAGAGRHEAHTPPAARLVMVQDDVAALARFDPLTGRASPILLPRVAGARRFDPGHGDKRDKPDLECLVSWRGADGAERLWCFGSGSTPRREKVAIVASPGTASAGHYVELPLLYAALREAMGDAGGEVGALNLEGAIVRDAELVLFQRGNGGGGGRRGPLTFHLAVADFERHLAGGPVPRLERVVGHDLGRLGDVELGFTDAELGPDHAIWWLAAAERSPDTFNDGEVLGSALGILGGAWAVLEEADGTAFSGKAEGLAWRPGGAWVVVDPDDPSEPTELLEVVLEGAW